MRRDYVTLDVRHADQDGDQRPTVVIAYDGPSDLLAERLGDEAGEPLDSERVDAAYRLQTPADADDADGVFSLTNRVTGEFVLEANADADEILGLVRTAREADTADDADGCYRIEVRRDGDEVVGYEKRTLLVYDEGGSLLRQHSLIPSGVEL